VSRVRAADAVRIALLTGIGGFFVSVVSGLLALAGTSSLVAVGARALLVTVLLVTAVRSGLRDRPASTLLPTAAVGLLAGHLLDLAWVSGSAYLARAFTQDVPVCVLVDLGAWLAVGLAALRTVPSTPDRSASYG
jgi:hypothetical protein